MSLIFVSSFLLLVGLSRTTLGQEYGVHRWNGGISLNPSPAAQLWRSRRRWDWLLGYRQGPPKDEEGIGSSSDHLERGFAVPSHRVYLSRRP